jgi:hypothetical protein
MELVVEHSMQQQKASLEKNLEGRNDVEKALSPLDKVSSDRRRRSSHFSEKDGGVPYLGVLHSCFISCISCR